jgi:hypothetical protein
VRTNVSSPTLTNRYLHSDHQGSIIAQSTYLGAPLLYNTYDAYGILGALNTRRFGYTGQIWLKELGLNHYKARVYSPALGGFCKRIRLATRIR